MAGGLGHFTFAVVELTFLLFIVLQSIDLYFGTSDEGKLVRSRALFGYAGFANEILYLRLVPVLLSLFFLHMPSLVTIEISLAIVFMTAVVPAISGAWDAYSVANITKYMNDIGLGFCEFFDDDDSNEVCANYYGLLFAWPLILIFGATIIVRSVQKSLPNLSSLLSLTLRLSLTLSLSLSLSHLCPPQRERGLRGRQPQESVHQQECHRHAAEATRVATFSAARGAGASYSLHISSFRRKRPHKKKGSRRGRERPWTRRSRLLEDDRTPRTSRGVWPDESGQIGGPNARGGHNPLH